MNDKDFLKEASSSAAFVVGHIEFVNHLADGICSFGHCGQVCYQQSIVVFVDKFLLELLCVNGRDLVCQAGNSSQKTMISRYFSTLCCFQESQEES